MKISPKDHISLDGDEYVLFDSNSGVELRFPVTTEGTADCIKATCGYFSVTLDARDKLDAFSESHCIISPRH